MFSNRRCWACSIVLTLVILLVACTEERVVFQDIDSDAVEVRAQVIAWRCGVNDVWNNEGEMRFAPATGDSAKVTFVRDNDFRSWQYTDDSSEVQFVLSKGSHIVIVETGYTRPDTFFNIQLSQDTNIALDIVYDILDKKYIKCEFPYRPEEDTLGSQAEWDILRYLNGRVGNKLNTYGRDPQLDKRYVHEYSFGTYIRYKIEVSWAYDNILDVLQLCRDVVTSDTTNRFSEDFRVGPRLSYICYD